MSDGKAKRGARPQSPTPQGGRVPPHDLEAERAVLGGILLENAGLAAVADLSLKPANFYKDAHAMIFDAMLELGRAGQPIDQITLRERIVNANKLERVGGDEYLLALTDTIPTIANIAAHARIVLEKSTLRMLIHAAHEIAAEGYSGVESVASFCDRAQHAMAQAAAMRGGNVVRAQLLSEAMRPAYDELVRRYEQDEHLQGYASGIHEVDVAISGFVPGDLIVIAGRPAMGKSAFATAIEEGIARNTKMPVVLFDFEMTPEQRSHRAMSSYAEVPLRRLRAAKFHDGELYKVSQSIAVYDRLPVWVISERGAKLSEMARAAREIEREHGRLGAIGVDYLQIVPPEEKHDTREQEVSQISRLLKQMAGQFNCPVLALSQLNRSLETRPNKRPMLSDLRESGAIEQDADTILFVYRDEVYNPQTQEPGIAEIIVGKQRQGAAGTVKIGWKREFARFSTRVRDAQEVLWD